MKLSREDIQDCVLYVHAVLVQECKSCVPVETALDLAKAYYEQSRISAPLQRGERAVVTLTRPKTAALFSERVWSVGQPAEDPQATFGWESPWDVRWRALLDLGLEHVASVGQLREIIDAPPEASPEFIRSLGVLARDIAADYRLRGANVSALYDSGAARDVEYGAGDAAAILAVAERVIVVDESALSWDQVRDFRRDSGACAAYRRFVHWLDGEMVGRPAGFIADEIASRLEQYEWALTKHGIETLVGPLEHLVDARILTGASAVSAAVQFVVGQPIWSVLAAGGITLGGAALSACRIALARKDLAMGYREIAYVQEAKAGFAARGRGSTE